MIGVPLVSRTWLRTCSRASSCSAGDPRSTLRESDSSG